MLPGLVGEPDTRMGEEFPSQRVPIAAVDRIGEESLLKMGPQQREELRLRRRMKVGKRSLLQPADDRILLGRIAVGKPGAGYLSSRPVECVETEPVRFQVVAVCALQSAVHVRMGADAGCARAHFIGWKEPLEQGDEGFRVPGTQRTERP